MKLKFIPRTLTLGWCRVEICHLAPAESQRYSMCAAFFKMAALITSLHDVVQEFIETPCRANINLDKDTRTRICSEVLHTGTLLVATLNSGTSWLSLIECLVENLSTGISRP